MALTVLDNMEYASDAAAQAAYVTNAIYGGIDQYTKLMLHMSGSNNSTTFTDSSPYSKSVTRYDNTKITTDQYVFDGSSGFFDGTGDYLSLEDSEDWSFGNGNFTVDFWVRFNVLPGVDGYQMIFTQRTSETVRNTFFLHNEAGVFLWCGLVNTSTYAWQTTTVETGVWYHIAIVRNGNNFYIFQNGIQVGDLVTGAFEFPNVESVFEIGRYSIGYHHINGWIDEFRVSKGVARWTGNFTAPSIAYNSNSYITGYSEPTIITDGSYSLKGIAASTTSLNKTLTRTITTPINLTSHAYIIGKIRASRTGSNIKIGFHDSGGTTTEVTPNITAANTWQPFQLDISQVPDANKDAIDQIIITVVNADYDTTFYLDMLWAFSNLSEPLFTEETPSRIHLPFRGNSRFLNYTI
jgi:hypothetical protein